MLTSANRAIFILAGEASGDRLGADLMSRFDQRGVDVEWLGVGGEAMAEQGLFSLFPMSDLSVMGLWDVLARLPLVFRRISQTVRYILDKNPDAVILIDSQEFSRRVAKRLRAKGFRKPILLYVAPTVWVYAPERARAYRALFDEVLAILPFEPKIMRKLGGPKTSYVGHPAVRERPPASQEGAETSVVALYPGSRAGELRRHLPLFREVVRKVRAERPDMSFVLPCLEASKRRIETEVADWGVPVEVVADRGKRAGLLAKSAAALAVSGTATLELAVAGVPMVIVYVMDSAQARKKRQLGNLRSGLPNIILNEDAVPELLMERADPQAAYENLDGLLQSAEKRVAQKKSFRRMIDIMESGEADEKSQNPENRILAHLNSAY
ncbi:MAG: lipid-A-disaccharide synthase [Hyphomicrobiaceae bacterium]|nr:lipid-A-disaccharide synthase [Hyphomicrobiaceae bacterium]MCC0023479.1 lipid-A-disaccharide synthase [Hyphomicrobiaceae bacterium]